MSKVLKKELNKYILMAAGKATWEIVNICSLFCFYYRSIIL